MVEIDAGEIAVNGAGGTGILAESFTADIAVDADRVVTTGTGNA